MRQISSNSVLTRLPDRGLIENVMGREQEESWKRD